MELATQEQMLDKYVGKNGTPEREEYDAVIRKALDDYRIGEAIRAERKRQGLTQEQLGERMGVQKAQVSKIENGKSPAYSSILRAFKALGAKTASIDLGDMGKVALW